MKYLNVFCFVKKTGKKIKKYAKFFRVLQHYLCRIKILKLRDLLRVNYNDTKFDDLFGHFTNHRLYCTCKKNEYLFVKLFFVLWFH
jgi:hypothetical protein